MTRSLSSKWERPRLLDLSIARAGLPPEVLELIEDRSVPLPGDPLAQEDGLVWTGSRWITDPDRIGKIDYGASDEELHDYEDSPLRVEDEARFDRLESAEERANHLDDIRDAVEGPEFSK